jgi:hypothetical protein
MTRRQPPITVVCLVEKSLSLKKVDARKTKNERQFFCPSTLHQRPLGSLLTIGYNKIVDIQYLC